MNLKGSPKLKHPFKRLISEIEVSQEFVKRLENSEPQKVTRRIFTSFRRVFPARIDPQFRYHGRLNTCKGWKPEVLHS